MKKKRRMLSYATTTSNKNSLLGTDRARQGKNNKKRTIIDTAQIDLEGWNNQGGSRRMMGREKKIRIKSDKGIYATCSLQVLHAKQNHAMERKLENSFTRKGRKWRVGQDMVIAKTARRTH
jgi:hypothetical protein